MTRASAPSIMGTLLRRKEASFAATASALALAACLAARRAASGTDWLGLSKRGDARDRPAAPAAASSGWVTVASKARLRAARQSAQSLAPSGADRPQIWQLIALPLETLSGQRTRWVIGPEAI